MQSIRERDWKSRRLPPGFAAGGATLMERVLAARGLMDPAEADVFLKPSLAGLHDPSLMADMDLAARRVLDAAGRGQTIAIYGDYDVDGVTAAAVLYRTILAVEPAAKVITYVPHRMEEGYGLNEGAVEQLAAQGAAVIVSVDCGITATGPALTARRCGVDLIITDHHNPPALAEDLPRAYAVVHPRRPGSEYPFGDLCGAGVAYKLAWRLATLHCGSGRVSPELRSHLIEMLALVSLGVIADAVPLLGENRVLARFGLARIKESSLPGLRALVEASGLGREEIDSEHAGFALAPRLNACGRMGHAREAVELFTTADGERARTIAAELCRQNERRRATERKITEHAAELALAAGMTASDRRAIVLAHEEWHPGVVGIVCSRLVERFGRPTILMRREDGMCSGSGRSIEGFSLHAGLGHCAGLLAGYGGHDMAAGVRVESGKLERFVEMFTEYANGRISSEGLAPALWIDAEAGLAELTPTSVRELDRLAPFGLGNPRPRIRLGGLALTQRKVFGSDGKHLSLLVRQGERVMRLVGWNWAEHRERFREGEGLEAVVRPKVSSWNGRVSVEPELEDARVERSGASA